MSRLLQAPIVVADARPLLAPDPAFDPAVTAAVQAAYERGRNEGHAAGFAQGVASAVEETHRAVGILQGALHQTIAACAALREHESSEVVALAAAIARVVVGREPAPAGADLLARIRAALAQVDDPTVAIAVSPADVTSIAAGLTDVVGLNVVEDPSLPPGEARIVGRWASVELTRAAGWAAVADILGDQVTEDPA